VWHYKRSQTKNRQGRTLLRDALVVLSLALIAASFDVAAQDPGAANNIAQRLASLTDERNILTREVDQYEKTLAILQTDGTPPEQSANPAVRTLAAEQLRLKQRLIGITEREVSLLQEQITLARAEQVTGKAPAEEALESKAIEVKSPEYSLEQEAEDVDQLFSLLGEYYTDLQESAQILPSDDEVSKRAASQEDAVRLARIPYSVHKVRLTGNEGSTALAQISQRLNNPNIPESRRDIAPICSIKTRAYGSLIFSESRSLRPVGKNHYLARIRLQPGDTTLRVRNDRWDVHLPQNINAGDYLITLYSPPGAELELHVFPVIELLATEDAHVPAWLPEELDLNRPAG
jgi:hypothetical protein